MKKRNRDLCKSVNWASWNLVSNEELCMIKFYILLAHSLTNSLLCVVADGLAQLDFDEAHFVPAANISQVL